MKFVFFILIKYGFLEVEVLIVCEIEKYEDYFVGIVIMVFELVELINGDNFDELLIIIEYLEGILIFVIKSFIWCEWRILFCDLFD